MPGAEKSNDKYKSRKSKPLLEEYDEPPSSTTTKSSKSKTNSKEPEIDSSSKKSSSQRKTDFGLDEKDKRKSNDDSNLIDSEKQSRHRKSKNYEDDEEDNKKSRHHRKKDDDDKEDKESRYNRRKEDDLEREDKDRHRGKSNRKHEDLEEQSSSTKEKHRSHRSDKRYDDQDEENNDYESKKEEKSRRQHKSKTNEDEGIEEDKPRRNHRSKNEEEDEDKPRRHHRSSKNKEEDEDKSSRKHRSSRRNGSDQEEEKFKPETIEEAAYEEDFENDFEEESEPEKPNIEEKKSKKEESKQKKNYSSDEDTKKKSSSKSKTKYNRYEDEEEFAPVRIVKANAHVKVPTELVECFSSKIYFNHDSLDRQQRRAKDLLKTIELDKKSFSILDIDPSEMRTAYSSHLKHEKVQTNDDVFEIEVQTDEIDYLTRWTQFPPEDSKGFGTDDPFNRGETDDDIFEKFRLEVNVNDLQQFISRASKVIETILLENNSETIKFSIENKSDFEFSQGFTRFELPKFLSKLTKNAILTNSCFNRDDPNYLACSYDIQTISDKDGRRNASLFIIWDINQAKTPYRVLMCESLSICMCYCSFMIFSGNTDGSVCVWDLREPSNLHKLNFKTKTLSDSSIIRTPTYSTACVLLNENHFSEVKSIIPLQGQIKTQEKSVFMQIATLELDCKLIIWTVVELSHIDLAGFETDLGLLPGGRIKLVKSSQIDLNNMIRMPFGKPKYQTLTMTSPLNQTNHLFICTNLGSIIHILRENETSYTTTLRSEFSDGNLQVTAASFHPEIQDILLAGYGNGELRLYHINYLVPIKTWNFACTGNKIKEIYWIPARSAAFIVVDEYGTLYIWDLLSDDTQPIFSKTFNELGGIALSYLKLTNKTDEKKNEIGSTFAMFNANLKEIDIHLFTPDWSKKSEKELKKFSRLIKNLLITF